MSDFLLQFGASNLCISIALAGIAWLMQCTLRRPALAHLMWVLVLAKLVTPPLWTVPMLPGGTTDATPPLLATSVAMVEPALAANSTAAATTAGITGTSVLLALWLLGSAVVLIWSLLRIVRFDGLLRICSQPAPAGLQQRADVLARRLLLANPPIVHLTSAQISPMVWWLGGRVRIYLPAALPQQMAADQLRWILAHELAHVRRRDHLVRWLEWLACVAFWWNPIAWLARRNLRANEEVCCDALVLQTFRPQPHTYANSLLTVVEFLAAPTLRPPAMASEINSGGFLERRFRMIVSKTPIARTPRWLQAATLLGTMALLPLGIGYAQNPDVDAVTKRLRKAVQAGELTPGQARTMLRTLRQQSEEATRGEVRDPRQQRRTDRTRKIDDNKRDLERLTKQLRSRIDESRVKEAEAFDRLRQLELELRNSQLRRADFSEARNLESAKKRLDQEAKSLDRVKQVERDLYDARRRHIDVTGLPPFEKPTKNIESEKKRWVENKANIIEWGTDVRLDQVRQRKVKTDIDLSRKARLQREVDLTLPKRERDDILKQRDLLLRDKEKDLQAAARTLDAHRQLAEDQLEVLRTRMRNDQERLRDQLRAINEKQLQIDREKTKMRKLQTELVKKERDLEAAAQDRLLEREARSVERKARQEAQEQARRGKATRNEEQRRIQFEMDLLNTRKDESVRRSIGRELDTIVRARDLTSEKADKSASRASKARRVDLTREKKTVLVDLERQLEELVRSGKLSKQDAKERWQQVLKKLEAVKKQPDRDSGRSNIR